MMKKILNDPYQYVDEMLAGLCSAHPELYRQAGEAGRVIARSEKKTEKLELSAEEVPGIFRFSPVTSD